jgi:alpha-tubulin suppressor-like RCC1 family protein
MKSIESGVYSFGYNSDGQLGLGNTTKQSTPQLISTLKNEKIKNVVCGSDNTFIITGKLIFY